MPSAFSRIVTLISKKVNKLNFSDIRNQMTSSIKRESFCMKRNKATVKHCWIKYLFNSRFILHFSGWFRCHWKWMEVCCYGSRQGLPDSLYFLYSPTFGRCFNSCTSCTSWIRGHSLTMLTNFCPFLTIYLPQVEFCEGVPLVL